MNKVRATVIGELPIAGVSTGGTVELDPAETNIDALVAGGHLELSKTAARKLDKATDSGEDAG